MGGAIISTKHDQFCKKVCMEQTVFNYFLFPLELNNLIELHKPPVFQVPGVKVQYFQFTALS